MRLPIVEVPSIVRPIQPSPGFAKKYLADDKLDIMGACQAQCAYCSTPSTTYHRVKREEHADAAEKQTGKRLYHGKDHVAFTWPDVIERLTAQLATKPRTWGGGRTLIFSQLTDGFSPVLVADGTTEKALDLVLSKTSFRIRVLTKNAVVGMPKWIEFFRAHPGRFVVGLSVGTLDDTWARKIEIGTSSPSARIRAMRALQAAGVPTFGMLCPVFPDVLQGDGIERLVDAIGPEHVDHLWWEPYNDRANAEAVRAGYEPGSFGHRWMGEVFGPGGDRSKWSRYATDLYTRVLTKARREGWAAKLRYLLYEGDITATDAEAFAGFEGVLLQATKATTHERKPTGWSANPAIRRLQAYEGHGCAGWPAPRPTVAA